MWQAPNQRIRALQSAKKRQLERLRRPLHIQKVKVEIKVIEPASGQDEVFDARVILNDVSKKGMGLLSQTPLTVGQNIAITIENPKQVFLRGKVVWCQEFESSHHVISTMPLNFRIGVRFLFNSQREEEAFQAFCDELARNNYDLHAA